MRGFHGDIEKLTLENTDFRHVVYTGAHAQLVLMTLRPGEAIGEEVHSKNDQFFRFERGTGRVMIDGNEYQVEDDFAVIVPAGANHNVANTGDEEVKPYTIYSPAEHREGVIHAAKEDAAADDEHFDGVTTEQ